MRTGWRIGLIVLVGLALGGAVASAQDDHPKVQDALEAIVDRQAEGSSFGLALPSSEVRLFQEQIANQAVRVVIEVDDVQAVAAVRDAIARHDGRVEMAYETSIQARIPTDAVTALAERDGVAFVRLPVRPRRDPDPRFRTPQNRPAAATNLAQSEITSEGLDVIGASAWHEAGLAGDGIDIGILDTGFHGYESLVGSDLPPAENLTTRSFREDGSLECTDCSEGDQLHGKAVAEIAHDVAPNARQTLVNTDFTDVSFRRAIDYLIQQDVDVINTSLWFASGCFEGGGVFEPQIAEARENGISWASSGGNFGGAHWQDDWQDPNNNERHNFAASDDTFTVEVEFREAEVDGERVAAVEFYSIFSWSGNCGSAGDDYRTVIYPEFDPSIRVEGDWVWRPGIPIKFGSAFIYSNDTSRIGTTTRLHLAIEKTDPSVPDARLDLLITGCPTCVGGEFDRLTPEGSVGILEPGKSANVAMAGAAHHSPAQCPQSFCPDGRLLFYSDRGPTKDGRTKPDIAGPTHVSTNAFGPWTGFGRGQNSGFGGSSAASPHLAGAMALVRQAFPDFSPEEVQTFLTDRAEDVGPPGEDNSYGAGLMALGQPPSQPEPTVVGIEPASGLQSADVEAVITGENLSEATDVSFSGSGVSAEIREGASESELPITIQIAPDAPTGERTFTVTTPAGQADSGSVTFTVRAGPQLSVAPEQLAFRAVAGGDAPAAQAIEITNTGGGTLDWQASANVDWIGLSATRGTAPETVNVRIEAGNLGPGQHQGTIVVRAPGAQDSPATVTVTLELTQPSELVVSPAPPDLDFGELTPGETSTRTVTLSNAGGGTLDWRARSDASWVSFSPTDGSLSGGASQDVEVAVDTSDLGPGEHTATIRFEAGDQSATGTVRVTVAAQPTAGELLVLEFVKLAFVESSDWERTVLNGCVRYVNASDGPSPIEVTRPDGTVAAFDVPAGNDVLVCGGVVHVDTRHSVENENG